jgi:galactokinase
MITAPAMQLRNLSEIETPEQRAPFLPALARLATLRGESDPRLREYFSSNDPVFLARAPGRLDVMGGIADYSGALVLELPLARSTFAIVQRQAAPRCDVVTRRDGRWDAFSIDFALFIDGPLASRSALARWFAGSDGDRWAAYVVGVVQHCLRAAPRDARAALPGLRLLVDSDVPEGKGVSSSAALEVATMTAVAAAYDVAMTGPQIAAACQLIENDVVGAPCGIMDQMTSACGRQDRLLRLRCQPGTIDGYVEIPRGYRFYGIDSGVRHAVTGADYGTVRTAAFMGYRMIAEAAGLTAIDDERTLIDDPLWRGYLANIPAREFATRFEALLPNDLSGAEFLTRYGGITDTATRVDPARRYPVRRATAHPIGEQERVDQFASLLEDLPLTPGAAVELGNLMYASHASYTAAGLGSIGTDRLVALVRAAGSEQGVFGAKITGGGSGGTVAVLGLDSAEPVVREIAARYSEETGLLSDVFVESGPGAESTGALVIETIPPAPR